MRKNTGVSRLVLPSVQKARLDKFKRIWKDLDEDTKQVIAGALYVLNHQPVGRPEAIETVKFAFSDYHQKILKTLTEYTRSV